MQVLPTIYAILIAFALVVATIVIHYEVLTMTGPFGERREGSPRARMFWLVSSIFVAHALEIGLYAVGYYLMQGHLGLGEVTGNLTGTPLDFLYFSGVTYTTLGFGDIYPSGEIRLIAGLESLNGLVLIGWSTSYTFLAMQHFVKISRRAAEELEGDEEGEG